MWQRIITFTLLFAAIPALAQTNTYTKFNFQKDCTIISEYELGVSAICSGYTGYPVIFSEGDLRHMVRFGHIAKLEDQWESFGEFNRANDTIEWRLKDKKPYAAILRYFIENSNSNGEFTKALEGQVLVVSTVGTHEKPASCVVGYVDARANKNANKLAQELADTKASSFICGKNKPEFFGKRGRYSGSPSSYFE